MNRGFLVSAAGFEPATHALKGRAARRISDLHRVIRNATTCYRIVDQQGFPALRRDSVALGRVWWWAQNWAQQSLA